MNEIIYRVINKKDNTLQSYKNIDALLAYMLGKHTTDMIFIKEDHAGVRVISLPDTSNASKLKFELEAN